MNEPQLFPEFVAVLEDWEKFAMVTRYFLLVIYVQEWDVGSNTDGKRKGLVSSALGKCNSSLVRTGFGVGRKGIMTRAL